mgnify:CR=1 FL=1
MATTRDLASPSAAACCKLARAGSPESRPSAVSAVVLPGCDIGDNAIVIALAARNLPAQQRTPEQVLEIRRDNAGAVGWQLTSEQVAQINEALAERGTPAVKNPV